MPTVSAKKACVVNGLKMTRVDEDDVIGVVVSNCLTGSVTRRSRFKSGFRRERA